MSERGFNSITDEIEAELGIDDGDAPRVTGEEAEAAEVEEAETEESVTQDSLPDAEPDESAGVEESDETSTQTSRRRFGAIPKARLDKVIHQREAANAALIRETKLRQTLEDRIRKAEEELERFRSGRAEAPKQADPYSEIFGEEEEDKFARLEQKLESFQSEIMGKQNALQEARETDSLFGEIDEAIAYLEESGLPVLERDQVIDLVIADKDDEFTILQLAEHGANRLLQERDVGVESLFAELGIDREDFDEWAASRVRRAAPSVPNMPDADGFRGDGPKKEPDTISSISDALAARYEA